MEYTRPLADIRVGGEIDAMCTRCRMLTNHRIVAMVDGFVKRVICLTCKSEHNYKQPAGAKKISEPRVVRVAREQKKTSTAEGARVFAAWAEKKAALDGTEAPPYSIATLYEVDSPIQHPKFGLGFVQKIIPPNKIDVMFETEIKTLAMNMR